MRRRLFLPLLMAGLPLAPAQALTVDDILAEARADCAGFEKGEMVVMEGAVQELELTGAAPPEVLVDWSKFNCSTAASLWGGTGGQTMSLLTGDGLRQDWLVLGWQVVQFGQPVLLLQLHGAECGGTGSQPCVEALVWGGESFLSVRAPGGDEDAAEGGQ
ncbi:MAG: hypothetical protein JNN06_15425 [Gemmobacter sp.]|uniref:hypothetical protein n=1 Tax=Gemmobacter sp. TaxID=1898957 RepID=UPI001A43A4CE|nr:hypothetical protein [Gemmobacter sp.]MBL8563661.1 hypothetical protein [Gemmobacter sp.]